MKWILVCLFLIQFLHITAESCTGRFMQLPIVTHRAQQIGLSRATRLGQEEHRLLTEYQFNCSSTTITSLVLGIDVREVTNDRTLYPTVQLYRLDSSENEYKPVPDSMRTIYYSLSNISTTGVYEYPLNPPISVTSGDLLAVSQPRDSDSVVRVYFVSGTFKSYKFSFDETSFDLSDSSLISDEFVLVYPVTADNCINSPINATIVQKNALLVLGTERVRERRQYLYPSITFSCNGTVTKWIYGAEAVDSSQTVLPELQIWRLIGPNNYIKTGSSLVNAGTIIGTNLYQFTPQTPLDFQEGDIFGVHSPRESESGLILYEQRRNGPVNLRIDSDDPLSTISSAALMTENNSDFPLVTVEISISTVTVSSTSIPVTSSLITQGTSTVVSTTVTTSAMINVIMPTVTTAISLSNTAGPSNTSPANIPGLTLSDTSNTPTNIPGVTSSNSSNTIIIIVVVVIVLVAVISCIVIAIVVLFVKRRRTIYVLSAENKDTGTLHNPLYGGSEQLVKSSGAKQGPPAALQTAAAVAQYQTVYSFYSEAGPVPNYDTPLATGQHVANSSQNIPYTRYEWGIIVPTMSQRNRMANSMNRETYHEVQNTIYSGFLESDNIYQTISEDGQDPFFTETDEYWTPGSDCSSIYEQLATNKFRELIRVQIRNTGHLGSGQFGTVDQGVWYSPTGPVDVAIKTLNDRTSEEEKVKFLQEAAIMGQFHHPNIVQLHGVVTLGEPIMIVIEIMKNGDMKQYLQTFRPLPGEIVFPTLPGLLLSFCRQIASGMEYLARKSFVHRDLAARNILVTEQAVCKISDFGLSRDLQDENYYISRGGQIPLKWTAPEAIQYKKYSSASDVWSFGVVMFEIWSLGHKPFQSMTNQEAFRKVESGYRLPPPPGCPRAIYEMMIQCWHPEGSFRLSFADLVSQLSQPDHSIVLWTQSDKDSHPQAAVLGAPLDIGQYLYTDLQSVYKE